MLFDKYASEILVTNMIISSVIVSGVYGMTIFSFVILAAYSYISS